MWKYFYKFKKNKFPRCRHVAGDLWFMIVLSREEPEESANSSVYFEGWRCYIEECDGGKLRHEKN